MRILVCFKVVRDVEYITPRELSALRDGRLELSVFQQVIGSYDEAALETALRLADGFKELGNEIAIHALTVGTCESRFAKNLYVLGFDEVICLATEQDITWRPEFTAGCIASFVKADGGFDLILAGKQAGPGENALLPRLLAGELGLPCLPEIIALSPGEKGIAAVAKTDRGRCSLTLIRPAVCAIGEAAHPYLRVATLKEKLNAASKKMRFLTAAEAPQIMGAARFLHYNYEVREKQCRFIKGANLEQKIDILWAEHLQQWVES
jgi:electron transfer flavoprotein alpha/beta subunit